MKVWDEIKKISFAEYALFAALFFVGIFHVYLSCILSIVLLIRLFICYRKKHFFLIRRDWTFISVVVLVFSYALVSLWAIDKGIAIFGFFKFLPLLLYLLVLMQEEGSKEKVIAHLPYLVTVMTLISVFCMQISVLQPYFAVSGRLSGFVQYPNTFAVILLVSELILLTKEKIQVVDYICITVLIFGILYTGSRTVLILAAVMNLIALIFSKNKTLRWIIFGCIGVGIVLVLAYCFIMDDFHILTRYLKISLSQSTFVGRMLYTKDAIPVVLQNPFGIGYMGYYFIQQSIQTGVYSIMFAHNDIIQILVDVGWIPCLVFLFAAFKTVFNKKALFRDKLVLLTILIHSVFDFDLQYIAVFMMLLLFMDPGAAKTIKIKSSPLTVYGTIAAIMCLCAYFGTVQALTRFELHDAASALYPFNTTSDIERIKETKTTAEAEEIADRILKRNSYVSLTYSVKARSAYEKGDFAKVIEYKKKCFDKAPFSHAEYWEYGTMLVNGIKLYEQAGDKDSAEYCRKELSALVLAVRGQKDRLSSLGAKIEQQPRVYFPKDLYEEMEALGVKG